jgi:tRNA threonylcarbamoyladenosine biosynthesis protein TsaB
MLLLAVDTSGRNGSIALARMTPGQSDVEIVEIVPLAGGAFSAQLVQQIAALLAKHEYSKTDLAAFAVVSGPGSFTGLRVGLAAIKALAEALHKPIVAISLLEAIACGSQALGATGQRVLAVLDAGRGDFYVGDYEVGLQAVRMHSERLLSREEILAEAALFDSKIRAVVTPDPGLAGTVGDMVRAGGLASGIRVETIDYPNSGLIARLGWEHLQRGQTVRPEDLEANYIRHSDAEIFSKPAP